MNNKLKDQWHQSYQECLASIEDALQAKPNDYEDLKNFRIFANWLMDNEHSSYDYMPSGFKDFKSNPYQFNSVLNIIHHALCDDGEISFVKMKVEGEVREMFIMFVWKNEDNFNQLCLDEHQSHVGVIINGRESMRRVQSTMKEKYPEKEFSMKPSLSKDDFTFEAHNDPLRFIKEFEEYQIDNARKMAESEEKMKALRVKMK